MGRRQNLKITLVIASLRAGGAERVLTMMANFWVSRGWVVTILTMDDGQVGSFYQLDPRVRHLPLGLAGDAKGFLSGLFNNLKRLILLRRAIKESAADTVISFLINTNVVTVLSMPLLGIPVIVSDRNFPGRADINRVWRLLRHWIYPFAEKIVVQTRAAFDCFPMNFRPTMVVIPNPVQSPVADGGFETPVPMLKPFIVAMGRLTEQKRFDLLIRAFASLHGRFPDWNLMILGEGGLRDELETLRNSLGLADRVSLPGRTEGPYKVLKQAEIFVLSSSFEGFPNALCEAMACGLPVVSTDCPCGPREIIRDRVDGLLVPVDDVEALTAAMEELMSNPLLREKLASRATEVLDRFSLESVMATWEALVTETIRQPKGR